MLSSSACQNQQPTRKDSTAVLAGDTTRHVLRRTIEPWCCALVSWIAPTASIRHGPRMKKPLGSCRRSRTGFTSAPPALPPTALLARGTTPSFAPDVSRARIGWTDAIARERTRDFAGAIRAYNALGARLDALRLRVSPPADEASKASARNELLSFISTSNNSADTREAIDLFDKVFKTTTPAEELTIARAASKASLPDRAAAGYAKSLPTGLGDATDNFSYGSVLYRLRRFADAAAQFDRVRTPPKLAAAAQYQVARAQIALGNTEEGRATLRRITTAYPTDTSAASALLLLADLATDDNRDQDARQALLTLLKRFPSGRHATSARFRAGMISYIQGDRKAAAAQLDSLVARDSNSSEALAAGYWAGRSYAALGDKVKSRARWRSVIKQDPLSYYAVMAAKRLDTTLVARDASPSAYPRVAAIDSVTARVAALKDVGMDVEAGFENDKLFRDALANPARLVATASALAGSDQASRSIALGKRAIDDIGGTPANYRLYFPGSGARDAHLQLARERARSRARRRAHKAGIKFQSARHVTGGSKRSDAADAGCRPVARQREGNQPMESGYPL